MDLYSNYFIRFKKEKMENKKQKTKKCSILLALATLCPFFLIFQLAVTEALTIIDLTYNEGFFGRQNVRDRFRPVGRTLLVLFLSRVHFLLVPTESTLLAAVIK